MHPEYHFQMIEHQMVDFPDDFLRSLYDQPTDKVTLENLRAFGQLYPLLVQQQAENRYHLLADYSYFTALKTLGVKTIACRILPPSLPPNTLFSFQILHGLASPDSSPILQAHLLRRAQHDLREEELLSLLSLMGHKPQRYKLKELSHLLQLEPSAILALHRGTLSPKSAKKLTLLPPQDQCELTHLINAYRLGGSKQQKLVEMVTELALRDGRAVSEIVKKWLSNQEMTSENRPQQVLGLLQSLQGQCYPNKTAAEKSFKSLVQELQPSGELTIEHSLSFEDETIEIRLRFPDPEKLKEKWEDIKRILQ